MMSKTLIAEKVKDGWYVKIIDSTTVAGTSDVYTLIRQNGLRVKVEFGDELGDEIKHIVAE